ncbi:phosphate signaling complex protein PhoU [Parasutterella muris]|uniref:phosphate signaling complex protein PhoU n=1 Tax=Parasutterella muris TaxID=2565572 RepID=UPI0020412E1F|nr:phosphate signaling complex protein PhoU [Parasutterella muris]
MRKNLDGQLQRLNNNLLLMGSLCEDNLASVFKAFRERDRELALNVYRADYDVDAKARDIETLCLNIILHEQPVAIDLLVVSATLKMVADLERIGNQASDIAQIVMSFDYNYEGEDLKLLQSMAKEASSMVKLSIDAFIRRDEELAKAVIRQDDAVDEYFSMIRKALILKARTCEKDTELSLDVIMMAKYLERIGDHACNIAKWVSYMTTGKINTVLDLSL